MATKLVKRNYQGEHKDLKLAKHSSQPKQESKKDIYQMLDDLVWTNVSGIKETVVRESYYQPIPQECLKLFFPSAFWSTD